LARFFFGSLSRKHPGVKPSCQISGRRSIFLGIEIRLPGMNEMNGRKFLQEQAHGRGKNDIMKAFVAGPRT
jgi:hypothetical protein